MKIILKDFKKDKKFGGEAYLIDIITLQKIFTVMITNGGYFEEIPFEGIKIGEEVRTGMSGCVDYSSGAHQTMSGRWQFPNIFYINEKRNEGTEYDPFEIKYQNYQIDKIKFTKILDKNIKDILLLIEDKVHENTDNGFYYIHYGDMGPYFKYLPLILRYRKDDLISLELGANLFWDGCSFNARFRWGELTIKVPKADPETETWWSGYAETKIGKTTIYYTEYYNRKIAYKTTKYKNVLIGFEQYGDIIHSPARIEIDNDFWDSELFFWRLGDISAFPVEKIKEYYAKNDENLLDYLMKHRKKVTEDHLRKVKIFSGNLTKENGYLYLESKDEPIILYHPEHGLLELPPTKYVLLEPNYINKGHD